MLDDRAVMKAICKVIKGHFPNLTIEKTLDIAIEILNAIDYLEKNKT